MTTTETKQKIAAMRAADPNRAAADMARELGISREAVRQHLVALGLPTTTGDEGACPCRLVRVTRGVGWKIVYCRLHAAAPEMAEALRACHAELCELRTQGRYDGLATIHAAGAALAKAGL